MGILRGNPVPPEWMNWLLRDWLAGGFYLRMDASHIHLYYGHDDLVLVLPRLGRSRDLTSRTLTSFMHQHRLRQKAFGRALETAVTGRTVRRSSGNRKG